MRRRSQRVVGCPATGARRPADLCGIPGGPVFRVRRTERGDLGAGSPGVTSACSSTRVIVPFGLPSTQTTCRAAVLVSGRGAFVQAGQP